MTYGYRRPPYGVRGCISEDNGSSWDIKNEIIICSDGEHGDIGYPSSIEVKDGTIMTSFYTHTGKFTDKENQGLFTHIYGTRYIVFVRFNV